MPNDDLGFEMEVVDEGEADGSDKDTSLLSKLPINDNARRIFVGVRRNRVLELRIEGYNYGEIASKVKREWKNDPDLDIRDLPDNWGYKQCANDVYKALDKVIAEVEEKARHYLWLEVRRLEEIQKELYPLIVEAEKDEEDIGPFFGAIDRYNEISKRKAKLLGLDEPEMILVDSDSDKDGDPEMESVRSFKWADPDDAPEQFKELGTVHDRKGEE